MGAATLSEIFTYPIKSTVASRASGAPLGPRGLRYDRHWAIFGETGDLLTARDHPDLLRVVTEAGKESLSVRIDGEEVVSMSYASSGRQRKEVDVWGVSGTGSPVKPAINDWFSSFLGVKCEVLFMDEDSNRPVHADYGGAPGDVVSYADECPVMILSEATVIELNGKLEVPVPVTQFRPNLVIANVEAAAEDGWKRIRVGECELEVTKQCKRCVSATINPESSAPSPPGERAGGASGRLRARGSSVFWPSLSVGKGDSQTMDHRGQALCPHVARQPLQNGNAVVGVERPPLETRRPFPPRRNSSKPDCRPLEPQNSSPLAGQRLTESQPQRANDVFRP